MENLKEEQVIDAEFTEVEEAPREGVSEENDNTQPEIPVVVLDEGSQLLAQALVSHTLSLAQELGLSEKFESRKAYKEFLDTKLRNTFSMFFPEGALLDLDINVSKDNEIDAEFNLHQGDIQITDHRYAVKTYLKLADMPTGETTDEQQ